MFRQQVTAGFFEAPSLWIPAFMATDKIHWLPIHSLMLMFDQCDCRTFSQCCLLTVDHTKGVKNILSRLLGQFMSSSALPFVGKMVIFMFIWLYLQILFKYRQNIKYKYAPFCDFQYKYTKCWYSNTSTYLNPTLVTILWLPTSLCTESLAIQDWWNWMTYQYHLTKLAIQSSLPNCYHTFCKTR